MNKKGSTFDELARYALWIIFFLIAAGGITLLIKKATGS